MSSYWLLLLMIGQLLILLKIPCRWWVLILLLISIFSLFFYFQQFDYNASRYETLWIYSSWSLLIFLNMYVNILKSNLGNFWSLFLQLLFLPLSLFSFLLLLPLCQALFIFLDSFFFLFIRLDNFNLSSSSLILTSSTSDRLLGTFSEISICYFFYFRLQNFLYQIISLLMYSSWWNIVPILSFNLF